MLVAPARTPTDIVDKLNVTSNEILNTSKVTKQLLDLGMSSIGRGARDELEHYVQSESARWGKVVADAGFAGSQ